MTGEAIPRDLRARWCRCDRLQKLPLGSASTFSVSRESRLQPFSSFSRLSRLRDIEKPGAGRDKPRAESSLVPIPAMAISNKKLQKIMTAWLKLGHQNLRARHGPGHKLPV